MDVRNGGVWLKLNYMWIRKSTVKKAGQGIGFGVKKLTMREEKEDWARENVVVTPKKDARHQFNSVIAGNRLPPSKLPLVRCLLWIVIKHLIYRLYQSLHGKLQSSAITFHHLSVPRILPSRSIYKVVEANCNVLSSSVQLLFFLIPTSLSISPFLSRQEIFIWQHYLPNAAILTVNFSQTKCHLSGGGGSRGNMYAGWSRNVTSLYSSTKYTLTS